jgi:hypothetical protein
MKNSKFKIQKEKEIENFWGYSSATNLTTLAKLGGGGGV